HLVDRRVERIAGVVDDDVDLAEGVDRLGDELVGRARLGQVAGEHRRLTVDLGARLLGDVSVEVVDEDLRAVLHEQLRRRPADAARRAGDDRRLAVEYSHSVALLLLLRVWERELYLAPLAAERDLQRERPRSAADGAEVLRVRRAGLAAAERGGHAGRDADAGVAVARVEDVGAVPRRGHPARHGGLRR